MVKWQASGLPPRRGASVCSVEIWLALSDGRVARGEALFNRAGNTHDWYLSSDDAGNPHRHIGADAHSGPAPIVVAWALIEPPAFPLHLWAPFTPAAKPAQSQKRKRGGT